jgi:hypothetical protein
MYPYVRILFIGYALRMYPYVRILRFKGYPYMYRLTYRP